MGLLASADQGNGKSELRQTGGFTADNVYVMFAGAVAEALINGFDQTRFHVWMNPERDQGVGRRAGHGGNIR